MRRARGSILTKYLEIHAELERQKASNGGIIGLRQGKKEWIVEWPEFLNVPSERHLSPVAACVSHNYLLIKRLGSAAVLCDPLKAVKLKSFEPKLLKAVRTTTSPQAEKTLRRSHVES